MRYNSLRSQLNWHSKQQTHLFKKLNKASVEKEITGDEAPPMEELPKGHELIWLEKMMRELQQYKEEGKDSTHKQPRQGESVDAVLKDKCGSGYRPIKIASERPQKVALALDQSGKSSKKIKFQIVVHSDKAQSSKKVIASQPKSKPKSAKKTPSKAATKKSLPQNQSVSKDISSSSKEVHICCPSNTKVIEVEEIRTDPYSFKETDLKILENLWKKQSENGQRQGGNNLTLTTKKSIGKIIRNSDKLNKTCMEAVQSKPIPSMPSRDSVGVSNQNSSYKQYKEGKNKQSISINSFEPREIMPSSSKELKTYESQSISLPQQSPKDMLPPQKQVNKVAPQKSKAKYEKIYIKLETEKLSEYLCQKSEAKVQEQKQRIIETNQYEKYCQTNRVEASTTSASINVANDYQFKSLTSQKLKRQTECVRQKESAPRAKSEQRKFNKCAQVVRTAVFQQPPQGITHKQVIQSNSKAVSAQSKVSQAQNRPQIKLKRRYDYKQDNLANKAQKLFTLHSVSSDHSEKQAKEEPIVIIPIPQQFTEEQQPSISLQIQSPSKHLQANESSCIIQPPLEVVESSIRESFYISEQCKDPTQDLTLLFNFLDEGHRGLLTDTNCQYQSLTEDLKLLFSAILNQIRTKKRFYNLQKFIEESKKVLEIKNQVYINNYCKSPQRKNMVYESLRQNVDVLKKKYPLMFVKCTFTQSCSEGSNFQSKKSSFNYGQSVVIDKVEIERPMPKNEPEEAVFKNCLQEKVNEQVNTAHALGKNGAVLNDIKWERSKKDKENTQILGEPHRKFSKRSDSNSELDILQPEIYLQKKYGFTKNQEEVAQNSEKMSTILQKTRGYLQNLDSYLKMR